MTVDQISLGKMLHIRALNHLRREHPFTYVGGRVLAEHIDLNICDDWTTEYLVRRAKTRREPVYWQYSLFKSLGPTGDSEFRNCLIGSPTTHLLEVWALWMLSQEPAFTPSRAVYSYLWPDRSNLQIFRHFMDGYRDRELAIAKATEQLEDPYVVVLDLKKFYLSIDTRKAFQQFKMRMERTSVKSDQLEAILQCAEGVCRPRKTEGLPIGPPLAHIIASIYLEHVDARLERDFPGRYFRYVDDIALVVEKAEVDKSLEIFRAIIRDNGLFANEDKTDIQPASAWTTHVQNRASSQPQVTFGRLIENLTQYLAHNPDEFDELHKRFRGEGLSLPFIRVKSISQYGPFRRFHRKVLKYFGITAIIGSLDPDKLLQDAKDLRAHFAESANRAAATDLPSSGIQRRWAIQNLRFTFNRLLYLVPGEELSKYASLLPDIDDTVQTREVYKALIQNNITTLVNFTGPTVAAFAQLWHESQAKRPHMEWSSAPKPHERDSIITLALYGICDPPDEWMEKLKSRATR